MKFLILSFLFFLSPAWAEKLDYKHCAYLFEKENKDIAMRNQYKPQHLREQPTFPFSVNEKGEIVDERFDVDKEDIDPDTREYVYHDYQPFQNEMGQWKKAKIATHTVTVAMSNNQVEQVRKVTVNHNPPPGMPLETSVLVMMEEKNGKCVPSWNTVDQFFGNQNVEFFTFDLQLCKDIQDFFFDNPEAAACIDEKSKINQGMNNLFKDFDFDPDNLMKTHYQFMPQPHHYGLTIEQRILQTHKNANSKVFAYNAKESEIMRKLLGSTPLEAGQKILYDCHQKGLKGVLEDKDLWQEPATETDNTNVEFQTGTKE